MRTNTPEGSAMSEPVSCNEQPVYQIDVAKTGAWFECTQEQFEEVKSSGAEFVDFRILYPASAYEALQARIKDLEKNSRDFTELCKVNDEAIAGYIAKIKELEEALGADPKVIAAAPDLLEALCDMVSDQEYLSSKTIEFAKKALEKALGVEAYWRCELLIEDKKQND